MSFLSSKFRSIHLDVFCVCGRCQFTSTTISLHFHVYSNNASRTSMILSAPFSFPLFFTFSHLGRLCKSSLLSLLWLPCFVLSWSKWLLRQVENDFARRHEMQTVWWVSMDHLISQLSTFLNSLSFQAFLQLTFIFTISLIFPFLTLSLILWSGSNFSLCPTSEEGNVDYLGHETFPAKKYLGGGL